MTSEITQQVEVLPEHLEEMRSLAKADLFFFITGVMGYGDFDEAIHGPICKQFENLEVHDILLTLPRGWFKTTLIVCYMIWRSVNNPDIAILLIQNTATNANAKLSIIKQAWEKNENLRMLFPELVPVVGCRWTNESLVINRPTGRPEGTYDALGVGGQTTSRHYDECIEDDTVAPGNDDMDENFATPSKEDISKAIGYHKSLTSVIDVTKYYRSVVVGTRWAEEDLISWVAKNEGDAGLMVTRAVREDASGAPSATGQLTWPSKFTAEALDKIKRKWGPYMFSCLYLNIPVRSEDMIFNPAWFQLYEEAPKGLVKWITVDLSNDPKENQGSDPDYFVCMATGKCTRTGRIYVLEYVRKRLSPVDQVAVIISMAERWKPRSVAIPKVGYEYSIKAWLTEKMMESGVYFNVEPIHYSRQSKEERIHGLQPFYSNGLIFHRSGMGSLEDELKSFPNGAHDDLPDALAAAKQLWLSIDTPRLVRDATGGIDALSFDDAVRDIESRQREERGLYGELLAEVPSSLEFNFVLLN